MLGRAAAILSVIVEIDMFRDVEVRFSGWDLEIGKRTLLSLREMCGLA